MDLNCYPVRELQAMAVLAGRLGRNDEQVAYEAHAATLIAQINDVFWHAQDSFCYDRHERSGELIQVKSIFDAANADKAQKE